jgi:MFS family permease
MRYPEFRWMFVAQFISFTGSTMQLAAVNWHIYDLTHDLVALGLVGLVRIVPIILFSLVGGVVADAMDRRKLMFYTQGASFIFAGILALATLTDHASLPIIYLMTACLSGVTAFDHPAWSALLPNLVPNHQIGNATRLNVVIWQITAVVGPVLAGLLLGAFGSGITYAVNAFSFVPVMIALLVIHMDVAPPTGRAAISFSALREGLSFVIHTPVLWGSMLLDFFATLFSGAVALLPVYASDILHVGATGYGILFAAPAVGSTLGALTAAQFSHRMKRQGELMLISVALYGVATVIFGISTSFWLSLIALALVGLMDSISTVIRNALRLLLTPDRLRGRMVSVNMIFFMGGPQLGDFEAGVVARATTPLVSVVFGGVATVLIVAAIALRIPELRQYTELAEPVVEKTAEEIPPPGEIAPQVGD